MQNAIRKKLRLLLIALILISIINFAGVGSGCDQTPSAEADFYPDFSTKVAESKEQLQRGADALSDSLAFMNGEFTTVYPGLELVDPDHEKRATQSDIDKTIKSIDNAIAELSADPSLPEPPNECAVCAERNQAVLTTRADAVNSLQKSRTAFLIAMALKNIRKEQINEINTIKIPAIVEDASELTTIYSDVKSNYEKYSNAYKAVTVPPSLQQSIDKLVAETAKMANISQAYIDAYSNWDNAAVETTYQQSVDVSDNELKAYNDILDPLGSEITRDSRTLERLKDDLSGLIKQFPPEIRTTS